MKRTNKQSETYFGVIVAQVAEYYAWNEMELVRDLITLYVEKKTGLKYGYSKEFVHESLKMMFNDGKTTRFEDTPESTGTIKMNEYWDRIREYFLDEHKFEVRLPNEPPLEFIQ